MIKYLAGIFDAEGYVRIRKTTSGSSKKIHYIPEVRFYMCDKQIVNLFGDRYGVEVKSDNRGLDRKIAYHVTIGVKQLKSTTFISDLLPFLNEKRPQLQEIYNLLEGKKSKEDCYQDYMKAKESFNHPIKGELDYEYIAGIIDGDGWFTMFNASKEGNSILNRFYIGLEQRYRPMIEYLLRFGGNFSIRSIKDKEHHRQTYEWKTGMRTMLPLLEVIEPFLIEKKQKCQDFIRYIKKCNELDMLSQQLLNTNK